MDSVLRALAVYLVLMILFRLVGKRSLSQMTMFDFVLLLVVGEATQQALLGEDFSVTNSALVITTLLMLDRASDFLAWKFPRFKRAAESVPVILVDDGQIVEAAMKKNHLSLDELLDAARETQGLERFDQIKWAILEISGTISIIPKMNAAPKA